MKSSLYQLMLIIYLKRPLKTKMRTMKKKPIPMILMTLQTQGSHMGKKKHNKKKQKNYQLTKIKRPRKKKKAQNHAFTKKTCSYL